MYGSANRTFCIATVLRRDERPQHRRKGNHWTDVKTLAIAVCCRHLQTLNVCVVVSVFVGLGLPLGTIADARLYSSSAHVAGLKSENLRDVNIDDAWGVLTLHNASLRLDEIERNVTERGVVPFFSGGARAVASPTRGNTSFGETPISALTWGLVCFVRRLLALRRSGLRHWISNQCPFIVEYNTMIQNKTGRGLFRLAPKLLALCSSTPQDFLLDKLMGVSNEISYGFQLIGDLVNLCSAYTKSKIGLRGFDRRILSFLSRYTPCRRQKLQSRQTSMDAKLFYMQLMRSTDALGLISTAASRIRLQLGYRCSLGSGAASPQGVTTQPYDDSEEVHGAVIRSCHDNSNNL
jgi:hypothetical protein